MRSEARVEIVPVDLETVARQPEYGAYVIAHQQHFVALRSTEEGWALNFTASGICGSLVSFWFGFHGAGDPRYRCAGR